MALPTGYLTSTKRLSEILDAIKTAKAPEKFTQKFLESLEFKAKGDRLIINVLKGLGFLDDTGKPLDRYFRFLDQTQSAKVLAEAIEDAYADLFAVNKSAQTLSKQEVVGKFKTLSQGHYSDAVLNMMAMTFTALVALADFNSPRKPDQSGVTETHDIGREVPRLEAAQRPVDEETHRSIKLGGLVYNIQIVLPETRDPKVYDALFRSLKEHLL